MRTRCHLGLAFLLIAAMLVSAGTGLLAFQPARTAQAVAPAHAAPAGEPRAAEGGHEGGSPIVGMIARLFNFSLLVGILVYFLRSPIATYLSDRGKQIRSDLVKAADMKQSAAAQLAAIDRKMAALPAELDSLRRTGAEEVAAEESRIRQAAETERTRLLAQSQREIEWQLKIAERALTKHAGALAVDLATTRVKGTITAADQMRLVDRYVAQVGSHQ